MGMISDELFEEVVSLVPLISIDILVKNSNKVLLGRRINKPAMGYFFTIGGRVRKGENFHLASKRIMKSELGMELNSKLTFMMPFEHFYKDGVFDNIKTHYVGLLYEYQIEGLIDLKCLPMDQHDEYRWFSIEELMINSEVHSYVKDFFRG